MLRREFEKSNRVRGFETVITATGCPRLPQAKPIFFHPDCKVIAIYRNPRESLYVFLVFASIREQLRAFLRIEFEGVNFTCKWPGIFSSSLQKIFSVHRLRDFY